MWKGHHHHCFSLLSAHSCPAEMLNIFLTSPIKVAASELCYCTCYMCVSIDVFIFFLHGFPSIYTQRGAIVTAVLSHSAPFYTLPRLSEEQQPRSLRSLQLLYLLSSGRCGFIFIFSLPAEVDALAWTSYRWSHKQCV